MICCKKSQIKSKICLDVGDQATKKVQRQMSDTVIHTLYGVLELADKELKAHSERFYILRT